MRNRKTDLDRVLDEAAKVMKNPQEWLDKPVPLLGGKTPREAVEDGEVEKVFAVIEALKDGTFL